jgi:hypothetical protein
MKTSVKEARIVVSQTTLTKAALRLLNQRLVTPEIAYVQQQLGKTATQTAIDDSVLAVRKLPWTTIVVAD